MRPFFIPVINPDPVSIPPQAVPSERQQLLTRYRQVRRATERLCAPLQVDDYQIQSIVQTSPPKWHIAHVSWFFETFVLLPYLRGYRVYNAQFDYLFNSYYYTHGSMHARPDRGLLSRPTVDEIRRYRVYVDAAVEELIETGATSDWRGRAFRLTLGMHHEQQHQELLLMDIKHNFSVNPLRPAYRTDLEQTAGELREMRWIDGAGGLRSIGHSGEGFAYDNETPRHKIWLEPYRLADRLVSNAEYLAFIEDGGYRDPAWWLADGWSALQRHGWQAPLYWEAGDGGWLEFTLGGLRELCPEQPVCHISHYEADAYARWAGKRLPLEAELECELDRHAVIGNFADSERLHPRAAGDDGQWFGDLWNWTASAYSAYPGFKPLAGSMGEYNGKFMSNQMVLRGGACVTPAGHTRASYRNFFYPDERWAFSGIRLAAGPA